MRHLDALRQAVLVGGSLLAAAGLNACSGASNLTGGHPSPSPQAEKDSGDAQPPPSEGAPATQPQQVSGAFLTCGYMETAANVGKAITAHQNPEIGCGIYSQSGPQAPYVKVDIAHSQLQPSIFCKDLTLRPLVFRTLMLGAPLQLAVSVNPVDLPCTLNLTATDSGQVTTVRRSIPTISQFDANDGFDVAKDQAGVQQVLGSTEPGMPGSSGLGTGAISSTATGTASNVANTAIAGIFQILNSVSSSSGQTVSQPPATTDYGSQVYRGGSGYAYPKDGDGH